MKNKTPIEWLINQLEEQIRKSAHNELGTTRTGEYRIGLRKAIDFCEEALEMENERFNSLNKQWANSREQSVHFATRIGFSKGVFQGFDNAEDYFNKLGELQSGDSFVDETQFNDDYIQLLWEQENKQNGKETDSY
jgi:hypothetical protein